MGFGFECKPKGSSKPQQIKPSLSRFMGAIKAEAYVISAAGNDLKLVKDKAH